MLIKYFLVILFVQTILGVSYSLNIKSTEFQSSQMISGLFFSITVYRPYQYLSEKIYLPEIMKTGVPNIQETQEIEIQNTQEAQELEIQKIYNQIKTNKFQELINPQVQKQEQCKKALQYQEQIKNLYPENMFQDMLDENSPYYCMKLNEDTDKLSEYVNQKFSELDTDSRKQLTEIQAFVFIFMCLSLVSVNYWSQCASYTKYLRTIYQEKIMSKKTFIKEFMKFFKLILQTTNKKIQTKPVKSITINKKVQKMDDIAEYIQEEWEKLPRDSDKRLMQSSVKRKMCRKFGRILRWKKEECKKYELYLLTKYKKGINKKIFVREMFNLLKILK